MDSQPSLGDFSSLLSPMEKSTRPKTIKETADVKNIGDQKSSRDINRTHFTAAAEYR